MSGSEKEQRRYGSVDETRQITKLKKKSELITDLKTRNVQLRFDDETKWKISNLQALAKSQTPPIDTKHTMNRTLAGWLGKPKGLVQVLWERGFIDVENSMKYRKHVDNETDPKYSLHLLISKCHDFATEITELEAKGQEMGVHVIITPKYHA